MPGASRETGNNELCTVYVSAGRYALMVCPGCPWAHRSMVQRSIKVRRSCCREPLPKLIALRHPERRSTARASRVWLQGLQPAIPMFLSQGWVVGNVALMKHLPAVATGAPESLALNWHDGMTADSTTSLAHSTHRPYNM